MTDSGSPDGSSIAIGYRKQSNTYSYVYTQLCRDTVVHIVHISCVKVHDGQTDVIVHSCRAILYCFRGGEATDMLELSTNMPQLWTHS